MRSEALLALCLQHRLRHFLHEQRNAVGALDDVLPDICWKPLVAHNAVDHGGYFALCQSIEGEGGHIRPSNPWWVELWPKRHNQEHTEGLYLINDATEQFEAGGVGPMCILKNHQQLVLARQGRNLGNECFERSLPTLLRCQVEHRVAAVVGQRQHVGKECGVVSRRRALCEQCVELVEFRLRSVIARKASRTLHSADDRIQCTVGVLRRAEIAQAGVWFGCEAFQQRRG